MPEIELIDNKGDWCRLTFTGTYRTSDKGLVETWVYKTSTSKWLSEYPQIPIPVFTEWFMAKRECPICQHQK